MNPRRDKLASAAKNTVSTVIFLLYRVKFSWNKPMISAKICLVRQKSCAPLRQFHL